ncbi:diguanylate cyclase [Mariprofundus sp. EBB-1]|uniref:diguanylate cyclase domain-containing protein n=1 Tax=Mariprofundus sp. EBB-1 TaxID=2650971 RepID=UPI000EF29374|nr:diguanylate cyclase [Mariprofundus sp. EBB-1]RLL51881.1 diguanylate cyclase [Mariprofundus sp. EBB-1]
MDKSGIIPEAWIARPLSDQQRLSDDNLRESEAYFRQLFELHHDVMLLIDYQAGIILDANPAAAEFYGYPLKKLRGMHVSQINAQHESEIDRDRKKAIVGEENIFTFEHRLANGDIRTVESHISLVSFRGKSLFFSIIHDITERIRADAELHIVTAAFESQESMVITDASGVILKVNHAFTKTTGYTMEEAVGQTPSLLKSGRHDASFYKSMWKTLKRTGKWQGEVWDRRKSGEIYPKWLMITAVKGDDDVTTHYVGLHLDITERKQAEEKINNMAYHDHLTGLANRALFFDHMQQAIAHGRRNKNFIAVLMLDLDHFKPINDALGHEWGDKALVEVSKRLLKCARATDTVARIGGDEFSIILLDGNSRNFACRMAEKIITAIGKPLALNDSQYSIGVSIGICLASPDDQDVEGIVSRADTAMYQAKESGRTCYRISE